MSSQIVFASVTVAFGAAIAYLVRLIVRLHTQSVALEAALRHRKKLETKDDGFQSDLGVSNGERTPSVEATRENPGLQAALAAVTASQLAISEAYRAVAQNAQVGDALKLIAANRWGHDSLHGSGSEFLKLRHPSIFMRSDALVPYHTVAKIRSSDLVASSVLTAGLLSPMLAGRLEKQLFNYGTQAPSTSERMESPDMESYEEPSTLFEPPESRFPERTRH